MSSHPFASYFYHLFNFLQMICSIFLSFLGGATYFMKVNHRPVDGYCNVTSPKTRRALIDQFYLTCDFWRDPEGKGISHYTVTCEYRTQSFYCFEILLYVHKMSWQIIFIRLFTPTEFCLFV